MNACPQTMSTHDNTRNFARRIRVLTALPPQRCGASGSQGDARRELQRPCDCLRSRLACFYFVGVIPSSSASKPAASLALPATAGGALELNGHRQIADLVSIES